ncbi:PREDICTED: uncharacterized protein LOC104812373 isoform X2 [Tarenaya hassleriana]|uniref:uncharacterized protein LOC104812373 isoform X2 n=1 Tax=Tarenaya hassleriana TaxID=28532 RepID=UPI00053C60B0|nr:PREDICTED: uncharacterized protein LOC104812373 isoform X2 [Tarenaya hassleriana]
MPTEESFNNAKMANSFMFWNDCTEPEDLEAMWMEPAVRAEWLNVGEIKGQRVHLSRDPDGQPYLTQTEMKAVADIIVRRHFDTFVDPEMLCALAELESDRRPLIMRYNKKTKETGIGLLQIDAKTVEMLAGGQGYQAYDVKEDPDLIHKPFTNVYYAAAYLKWMSNYQDKPRSEEFIVRTCKGGTKKATHKSTLPYWKRYLSVKESLPSRKSGDGGPTAASGYPPIHSTSPDSSTNLTYWDSRASPEDMENMWNHPAVRKEWTKSGEEKGKVRFSQDSERRPYLSRVELKAVAEIIVSKYFSTKGLRVPTICAVAEIVSMRFVNGVGKHVGILGVDYATASWLHTELGYRAYRVDSADDLTKPFVSMYFGTAYLFWLSAYEGRDRSPQFIVQAIVKGPQNVNLQEAGPAWLKFEQSLSYYEESKRDSGNCIIL